MQYSNNQQLTDAVRSKHKQNSTKENKSINKLTNKIFNHQTDKKTNQQIDKQQSRTRLNAQINI